MNVQRMQNFNGSAELRTILPTVHLLWGEDYSAVGPPTNIQIRVQHQTRSNVESLDVLRAQRSGDTQIGERANGNWPGAIYGVRAPDPAETPLSWAEVHVLRSIK